MARRVIAPGRCCLECRRRKIKCDRASPCGYCVRSEIRCQYPPATASSSSSKSAGTATGAGAAAAAAAKQDADIVVARLETIERSIQSLEGRFSQMNQQFPPVSSHGLAGLGAGPDDFAAWYNSPGRSSSSPASHVAHQLGPTSYSSPRDGSNSYETFPFNSVSSPTDIWQVHPPAATISLIWQTYLEVIDPVLKMFHVPTTQKRIMTAVRDPLSIDAATESLLFAIYYSTAVAMPAVECENNFHCSKAELTRRYRGAIEGAFSRAKLLTSQDLTVMQAFVLYITCGRRDEYGPDVSSLIGIAVGNALRMGLHCTETTPGLTPFDMEMRRRVWWQISTLDARIAEEHNIEPSILDYMCDTRLPTNVNDMNLDPDMTQPAVDQAGKTEMMYSLVRFQSTHFARRVLFSDQVCRRNGYDILSPVEKRDKIDGFWEELETKYLSFCDKNIDLNFITVTSVRLVIVKWKLAVSKPLANEKQDNGMGMCFRKTCEEVLQCAHALRQYEKGRRWLWLFQTYVEWDALTYLLMDLCLMPDTQSTDVTWKVIDEVYYYWRDVSDVFKDRRWERIEDLRREALAARIADGTSTAPAPQLNFGATTASASGSDYQASII